MNRAIKLIENEIKRHTLGYEVVEVVEVSGTHIIVEYKETRIFGHSFTPVEVGQIYIALSVYHSPEHDSAVHMISPLEKGRNLNCIDLGAKLVGEELEVVLELNKSLKLLRSCSSNKNLTLQLPDVKLVSFLSADPDYPGIAIDIIPDKDGVPENAVLIEHSDSEGIVIHVWEQNTEDPVYRKVWSRNQLFESQV